MMQITFWPELAGPTKKSESFDLNTNHSIQHPIVQRKSESLTESRIAHRNSPHSGQNSKSLDISAPQAEQTESDLFLGSTSSVEMTRTGESRLTKGSSTSECVSIDSLNAMTSCIAFCIRIIERSWSPESLSLSNVANRFCNQR